VTSLKKIWFISLIVKLIVALLMPLSADEAYYWVWSHNLRLSYFDHPPMVAWLLYLGHFLEPIMNAVRWPTVLLGHLTLLVWILILKPHVDLEKIKYWLLLALFSPLIGFGSLITTPDVGVLFFWSLSIYLFQEALFTKKSLHYALLGLALGLGFCAKYHIVLFVPFAIAYLLFEKKWKDVQWKYLPLTILMGLIFCSPVLIWNYQNEFASFTFQFKHGLERPDYKFEWTYGYVLGQVLALFPLVVWAAAKAKVPKASRIFLYFGWGPLLFFFLTSFRALVEANWPFAGYTAVFALMLFHPRVKLFTRITQAFWGFIYVLLAVILVTPSIRGRVEKADEPFLYQELSSLTHEFSPLYGSTYQMASSFWYFGKTPTYKLQGMSRYDFYDTLAESKPTKSPFYLVTREGNSLPQWVSEEKWSNKEIRQLKGGFTLLEFTKE
jgi:4-amino-4-deoxy-L-arabinose transferase-like glycosyltransferase